jgi:CRISPR/Cas system-associated endoribonuclease Cas2
MATLDKLIFKAKEPNSERQICVLVFHEVEDSRVEKVNNQLGKYLNPIEKNVFEGELTKSQLDKMRINLQKTIREDEDGALVIYKKVGYSESRMLVLARVRNKDNRITRAPDEQNEKPLFQ